MKSSTIVAMLACALVMSCTGDVVTPSRSSARANDAAAGVAASGDNVRIPFTMTPPPGAPYPDAAATGYLFGLFLNGDHPKWPSGVSVDIRMHGIPCPTTGFGLTNAQVYILSRQFYAVYASTDTHGSVRLASFMTNCRNETLAAPLPVDLDWFSEDITVVIRLETDDGDDAGPVVLRGTIPAAN